MSTDSTFCLVLKNNHAKLRFLTLENHGAKVIFMFLYGENVFSLRRVGKWSILAKKSLEIDKAMA